MGGARLDVVELGPKTVATVHAQDPVESGWLASSNATATWIGMFLVHRANWRRSTPS
jgi:hypothetical protein